MNLDQISPPSSSQRSSGGSGFGGGTTGAAGGGNRGGGGFGGSGNPVNNLGRGMDNIPVTEIAVGIGVLIVLIVVWRVWRKRTKGKKISFKIK